jgi:hypothetical protein
MADQKPQSISDAMSHVNSDGIKTFREDVALLRAQQTKPETELSKALDEFKDTAVAKANPDSLLTTEDDIFNTDSALTDGTIITDTKHKRWRLGKAVEGSVSEWLHKQQPTEKSSSTDDAADPVPTPSPTLNELLDLRP